MSIIEGIGDEVFYLFLAIAIIFLLYALWLSTFVSPRTFSYNVVIDVGNILGRFVGTTDMGENMHADNLNNTSHETTTVPNDIVESISEEAEHQENEGIREEHVRQESNETDRTPIPPISTPPAPNAPEEVDNGLPEHADRTDNATDETPSMRIRLQYIDGKQKTVFARPGDTVGEFKRRNFSQELSSHSIVRFIMGGKELKNENLSLQLYNVKHDDIIHCLVSNVRPMQVPSTPSSNVPRQRGALDIGTFIFPMFGLALGFIWYARIFHRTYFNGTSTFSLVAITFLYILSLLASYRVGSQNDNIGHLHQE